MVLIRSLRLLTEADWFTDKLHGKENYSGKHSMVSFIELILMEGASNNGLA